MLEMDGTHSVLIKDGYHQKFNFSNAWFHHWIFLKLHQFESFEGSLSLSIFIDSGAKKSETLRNQDKLEDKWRLHS